MEHPQCIYNYPLKIRMMSDDHLKKIIAADHFTFQDPCWHYLFNKFPPPWSLASVLLPLFSLLV